TTNTPGATGGTIRLDVNESGTGIADLVGNAISGGFSDGPVYTLPAAPAAPVVNSPDAAQATSSDVVTVSGTAAADALVEVWTDASKTVLAGSQQLTGGATAYSISATLAANAVNNLVVTATDSLGNQSAAAAVPTIT